MIRWFAEQGQAARGGQPGPLWQCSAPGPVQGLTRPAKANGPRRNGSNPLAAGRLQLHKALPLKLSNPGQRLASGSDPMAKDSCGLICTGAFPYRDVP
jgi:hypothetical protein